MPPGTVTELTQDLSMMGKSLPETVPTPLYGSLELLENFPLC